LPSRSNQDICGRRTRSFAALVAPRLIQGLNSAARGRHAPLRRRAWRRAQSRRCSTVLVAKGFSGLESEATSIRGEPAPGRSFRSPSEIGVSRVSLGSAPAPRRRGCRAPTAAASGAAGARLPGVGLCGRGVARRGARITAAAAPPGRLARTRGGKAADSGRLPQRRIWRGARHRGGGCAPPGCHGWRNTCRRRPACVADGAPAGASERDSLRGARPHYGFDGRLICGGGSGI